MRLIESTARVAAAVVAIGTHVVLAQQIAPAAPVFFFTKFPTSTTEYRDKLISMFDTNAKWSCGNETGTSKYGLAIPRGGGDNKTMYSIEQYRDDAQFQEHLRAPLVASMFAYIGERPDFWGKAGVDSRNWTVPLNASFVKEGYATAADPYLVVSDLSYQDDRTVSKAIAYWRDRVATAKADKTVLLLGVYGDPVDKKALHVLSAFETKVQYEAAKKAVSAFPQEVKPAKTTTTLLQKVGGYLYQDPAGKACG